MNMTDEKMLDPNISLDDANYNTVGDFIAQDQEPNDEPLFYKTQNRRHELYKEGNLDQAENLDQLVEMLKENTDKDSEPFTPPKIIDDKDQTPFQNMNHHNNNKDIFEFQKQHDDIEQRTTLDDFIMDKVKQ